MRYIVIRYSNSWFRIVSDTILYLVYVLAKQITIILKLIEPEKNIDKLVGAPSNPIIVVTTIYSHQDMSICRCI